MTSIPRTRECLQHAAGLAAILDAAHDAFEDMLLVIRTHEDPGSGLFAAFIMAAASAADGRDAIAFAPSLGPCPRSAAQVAEDGAQAGESAQSSAEAVARLSQLLAARLVQAGESGSDPRDRAACSDAARCAARIHHLLGGSGP